MWYVCDTQRVYFGVARRIGNNLRQLKNRIAQRKATVFKGQQVRIANLSLPLIELLNNTTYHFLIASNCDQPHNS